MPRNTYLLVSVLAVIVALVVGVNIGRRVGNPSGKPTISQTPAASSVSPSPGPIAVANTEVYTNPFCRISFDYPAGYTKLDSATTSAAFTDPVNQNNGVLVTCQKNIPRPAVAEENIETTNVGSVSAKIFHATSPKDGTAIDSFIVRHPKTGLDIFIAGIGPAFHQITKSLKLLP